MQITLADWLAGQETSSPLLNRGLAPVAEACRVIAGLVARAPLEGLLGSLATTNIQDEVQKALDMASNDVFLDLCGREPAYAGFASEELDEVSTGTTGGELLLAFDPLDGSSNIDVAMCVGSIFSVLPAPAAASGRAVQEADFLQPGRNQLAAGYALYGPQAMFVLSVGAGVAGFTLDRERGEWILTHPDMTTPEESNEYAINASNERHWKPGLRQFMAAVQVGREGPLKQDFNMRWTAAMVADVHRILVRGGIFLYPADTRPKVVNGKLRLLYECAPMGWLVEKAGGVAYGAEGPVLDVRPSSLHQRSPIALGSRRVLEQAWADYLVRDTAGQT
jgi:fructose-1,6-bisphosphatase I